MYVVDTNPSKLSFLHCVMFTSGISFESLLGPFAYIKGLLGSVHEGAPGTPFYQGTHFLFLVVC